MLNITVVGTGYVGLSNAVLFALQHKVISLDIDAKRVELINQRLSPIVDEYIEKALENPNLNLKMLLIKLYQLTLKPRLLLNLQFLLAIPHS